MKDYEIINELVKLRKWSQTEFAKESGVSRQSIHLLMKGVSKNLRIDIFVKYLYHLGAELRVGTEVFIINDDVNNKLKQMIKDNGYKRKDIADIMGLKVSTFNERLNTISTKTDTLVGIANAIGVKVIVRDRMGTGKEWVLDDIKESEEDKMIREYEEMKEKLKNKGLI